MRLLKRAIIVVLVVGFGSAASAESIEWVFSESEIPAGGSIDWGSLGPDGAVVWVPFSIPVPGLPGQTVTVSKWQESWRFDYKLGHPGNFALGEKLLSSGGPGNDMTFDFSSPIQSFGLQIGAYFYGKYTATMTVYDSTLTRLDECMVGGESSSFADDSAPFLGFSSNSAHVSRIIVNVLDETGHGQTGNFLVNGPRIAGVPEPATVVSLAGLACTGLLAWTCCWRRKPA